MAIYIKPLWGIACILSGCAQTPQAPVASLSFDTAIAADNNLVIVSRIYDGDTIDVFNSGETTRVRLACIDSAENDQQPHGTRATNTLSSLLPGQVRLNVVDTDRYGRLVAEVFTPEGNFVNLQMIEAGEAVVYRQYLDNCDANADALLAAEERARTNSVGVWGDPNFIMPWDYRQGVRTEIPEPRVEAVIQNAASTLPPCVSGDCDCGDFTTWQQALDVLAAYPNDPHRLDGDNDGEACESLPK